MSVANDSLNVRTLPAVVRKLMPNAALRNSYELAKDAIEKSLQIDECKEWADKAAAMATWAREAKDDAMFVAARRIRARAIQKIGELLIQLKGSQRGAGARRCNERDYSLDRRQREVAVSFGLSSAMARSSVLIAAADKRKIDEVIESPRPPAISALEKFARQNLPNGGRAWETRTKSTKAFSTATAPILEFIKNNPSPGAWVRWISPTDKHFIVSRVTIIEEWFDGVSRFLK